MKLPSTLLKRIGSNSGIIYFCLFLGLFLFFLYGLICDNVTAVCSVCFWAVFLFLFYLSRMGSDLHKAIRENNLYERLMTILVAAITVFYCIAPMDLSPTWNGENPDHRNQYELLAESFLDGRLYIEYGDEEELLTLNNPYDPEERRDSGVAYHWDHAFYNGRYYMYFGVAPVLFVFLPYRILTGNPLTTFRATQLFTAGIVLGFFALFRLLSKKFFKKITLGMYLFLSAAFSVISVWHATAEPALYDTAITAGICAEVWSIFFFCKGVLDCHEENTQLIYAAVGSMLGALTFACRPPIGLANIVVLPLLIVFLRQRTVTPRLVGKLFLAALPYFVVAAGLMLYNYARFQDPFEFGQTYQLTSVDQLDLFESVTKIRIINDVIQHFFDYYPLKEEFPYITHGGTLFNFPIFLCLFSGFLPHVQNTLRNKKLVFPVLMLVAAILLIAGIDAVGSPYLLERYRMDTYFLVSILCFLMIGTWHEAVEPEKKKRFSSILMHLSVFMILLAYFHYLYEIQWDLGDYVAGMESIIFFWRSV